MIPLGDVSASYLVHASDDCKICICAVFCRNQNAISLCGGDVDHVGLLSLGPHTVNLDDLHGVAFEPDVLGGEGRYVDDAEEVGLAGLHSKGDVLSIVDESRLWHRLGTGRICDADKAFEQAGHGIVIVVAQSHDDLLIDDIGVRRVRVIDEQRA